MNVRRKTNGADYDNIYNLCYHTNLSILDKGKLTMYIKIRKYYDGGVYYKYCIHAGNHIVMGLSDWLYGKESEAIYAAKKLAKKLGIVYRGAKDYE